MLETHDDDKSKVAWMISTFTTLTDRFSTFRKEAGRNYDHVIGDMISTKDRKKLNDAGRPVTIYNLHLPILTYLSGTLATNKNRLRAIPIGPGDEQLAGLHTALVSDYAMENCDGYYEISKASLDAAIGKIGWLNNYMSYREDPEGKWITEAFDPFMIMFDPDARKIDQTDWRYYTVSAFYGVEGDRSDILELSQGQARARSDDARRGSEL